MGYVPSTDARLLQFHSNHCNLGAGELRFTTQCAGTLIVEPDCRETSVALEPMGSVPWEHRMLFRDQQM